LHINSEKMGNLKNIYVKSYIRSPQMTDFQNSKRKYERRKILDFAKKKRENLIFFEFLLLFILVFNYFEVCILF
jgi:hypothetical protein